jgi:sterol desaturase/sphingolipid hydroxylase (fatty acid hydroxylase superfamily)
MTQVTMNDLGRVLIGAVFFAFLFLLERLFPLRRETRSLIVRLLVNAIISAGTFIAAMIFVRPVTHFALHWSADRAFGLIHIVALPTWVEFALSILLMDLAWYYWHLANHRVSFLWRFHNVHHIDPDLDVSTAFRFHFGEIAFSAGFNLVQISLIGISPWAFTAYQIVFLSEVLFHHSNVRMPIGLERVLSKVIVTPRMHGIHHSQVHRENNSNFGTVFTWWDRLHRTLGLNVPQSEVVIGVPAYSSADENKAGNALLMPFRKQRDYWRTPDGQLLEERDTHPKGDRTTLAE